MSGIPSNSYARNLLEKYGWAEGKGLGKTEHGMVEALKPKLKFDNTGIGHDHAEQFTNNWWEVAFNEAAKRVSVGVGNEKSGRCPAESSELPLSTKRASVSKLMKENSLKYGKFIKTETLTSGGEVVPLKQNAISSADSECTTNSLSNLTDEELLKICGGRTAHKAARHGNKLVGKLARVTEQEKTLLLPFENMKKHKERTQASEDDGKKYTKKKRKGCSSDVMEESQQSESSAYSANCDVTKKSSMNSVSDGLRAVNCECNMKKKKKRHHQSVCGSESKIITGSNCDTIPSHKFRVSDSNKSNSDSVIEPGNASGGRSSKPKKKKSS